MHRDCNSSSSGGIGLGSVLAVVLSWMKWHSIGWAIVHGIFGWFYVLYYWFNYSGGR